MSQSTACPVSTAPIDVRNHGRERAARHPAGFWLAVAIGLALIAWSALLLPFVGLGRAVPDPATAPGRGRIKLS